MSLLIKYLPSSLLSLLSVSPKYWQNVFFSLWFSVFSQSEVFKEREILLSAIDTTFVKHFSWHLHISSPCSCHKRPEKRSQGHYSEDKAEAQESNPPKVSPGRRRSLNPLLGSKPCSFHLIMPPFHKAPLGFGKARSECSVSAQVSSS